MNPIEQRIRAYVERAAAAQAADLYFYLQPVGVIDGAHVTIGGRRKLLASSYSYLGLLGHPEIRAAVRSALDRYGTGTHGVRLLAGNTDLHDRLEASLANCVGTQASVVFSSGYLANVATIAALLGRGDAVVCDKLDHASIIDGCLLSGARFCRVPHNDTRAFDRALAGAPAGSARMAVADAVFSMDGDIIDLPELAKVCRRRGAWLMIDESHSLGVLGDRGQGIEAHFGLQGVIDVKMGSLSKSIPSAGGYIAGSQGLITYLKHAARAFVFSAALPPPSAAAILASLSIMEAEPERVSRLQTLAQRLRTALREGGIPVRDDPTPVIPIITGDDETAMRISRLLDEKNIFAPPIISPAVPPGKSRLRITVTAAHASEEVDRIAEALIISRRKVIATAARSKERVAP